MQLSEFRASLSEPEPTPGLDPLLHALWLDAKGDWDGAHRLAQKEGGGSAAWLHAYLHRREGDLSNARHWYRRAGRAQSAQSLAAEWEEITVALLAQLTGSSHG